MTEVKNHNDREAFHPFFWLLVKEASAVNAIERCIGFYQYGYKQGQKAAQLNNSTHGNPWQVRVGG